MTDHAPSLHLPPADAASITYRSNLAEVRAFVRAHAAVAGLASSRAGHGPWLTRQLCDAVDIGTSPTGTTICLHMQLDL